jgi:D-3-phosphoglycerate dehydrogenase / 2-oxoglutarate reductase
MKSTSRPRAFLTHTPSDLSAFFPSGALERLRAIAHVDVNPSAKHLTPRELDSHAPDANYLITEWNTGTDEAYLRHNPSLVGVVRVGVEILNVDVAAATEHGVLVVNLPGIHQTPVIELTLAFMIMLARRVPQFEQELRSGETQLSYNVALGRGIPSLKPGFGLEGATVGLVGLGYIGAGVARLLRHMGAQVLVYDPYVDTVPDGAHMVNLDELLRRSQIVSLHAKLTPESRHMIGHRELAMMRPDGYLVNTARGDLVDTEALVAALAAGSIAGAAVDVFEGEPDLAGNPLLHAKNCVVTPHMSGHTAATFERLAHGAVLAVEQMIHGELPLGIVNREAVHRPNFRLSTRQVGGIAP